MKTIFVRLTITSVNHSLYVTIEYFSKKIISHKLLISSRCHRKFLQNILFLWSKIFFEKKFMTFCDQKKIPVLHNPVAILPTTHNPQSEHSKFLKAFKQCLKFQILFWMYLSMHSLRASFQHNEEYHLFENKIIC